MVSYALAQDDPNDTPLGDVARSLRKKTGASQNVIDDDNFSKVMAEAESNHAAGSALRFLMAGEAKSFQISSPDATCSLAFNASAKTLLSSQFAQMELPAGEMLKLTGPATIEGDALTVSVFNGTDWHVSEVAIALTVVKKKEPGDASFAGSDVAGALGNSSPSGAESEVRPEKKPDRTVIYRMRAAAPPSSTTVFSAPLNLELPPGEEWHWALVQARGYPPESSSEKTPQTAQVTAPALSPGATAFQETRESLPPAQVLQSPR
jgi:hypothetical protein